MTYVLRLDRDTLYVRKVGERSHVQVRGAPHYATHGYDPGDPLHQLLDRLDPPSVAVLMTGVEYTLNLRNPRSVDSLPALDQLMEDNP